MLAQVLKVSEARTQQSILIELSHSILATSKSTFKLKKTLK